MESTAVRIWNRATMEDGGSGLRPGDRALSGLLSFHSLAMSGGVLDAVERTSAEDLNAAQDGFRFFGMDDAAKVVVRVRNALAGGNLSDSQLDDLEREGDDRYSAVIPRDQVVFDRFESLLRTEPDLFAPA